MKVRKHYVQAWAKDCSGKQTRVWPRRLARVRLKRKAWWCASHHDPKKEIHLIGGPLLKQQNMRIFRVD